MNSVVKRLIDWKEVPVDSAVLSFNYLQMYYIYVLQYGFCRIGNYKLKQPHLSVGVEPEKMKLPENCGIGERRNELRESVQPAET